MQPHVPYLLGQPHPEGSRLADSQLSFRAEDIEEVGDNRHTTFFEMLGNWSFGDYFKAEQLAWFFAFLTDAEEGLGLDPAHLYVTVFGGDPESGMAPDTESVEIWHRLFAEKGIDARFKEMGTEAQAAEKGMEAEGGRSARIFSYGAKKNWWSRAGVPAKMPPGEIGGPDSEVFYDFAAVDPSIRHDGAYGAECHPNCDCGRFIEIGNSVFMQYLKQPDGSFKELPKRNVDFGGGLERQVAATRGSSDVFLIDVFGTARAVLERRSGQSYGELAKSPTRSFRIILDHMRAASFMLASGITPSNSEQGYVLRRLIRRSIREADKLGIKEAVLADVAEGFGSAYADAYPFVRAAADRIRDEIAREEAQFRKTLANGLRVFERAAADGRIGPEEAFELYTTYGFPIEMAEEMAAERGIALDRSAVAKLFEAHQAKSRAGAAQKFAGGLADHAEATVRYHTAHHLLLKALQQVLGPEVHQRGSNITSERLRMDFSYGSKMTAEQIAEVERIVNEKIQEALPVERVVIPRAEAEALGAEREFGAAYPDTVSVYFIGAADTGDPKEKAARAFSIEFCGGPHVGNTAELIGTFKVVKEEASSAGVRRIRAVLE
jgi:alanyl-tRNA synthetase